MRLTVFTILFFIIKRHNIVATVQMDTNNILNVLKNMYDPDCPNISDILHGESRIIKNGDVKFVKITCEPGYALFGLSEIKCVKNWWGFKTIPYCKKLCSNLQDIENGEITFSDFKTHYGNYLEGTIATYKCEKGFELVPADSIKRRCNETGSWTGVHGSCIKGCLRPNGIFNGYFVADVGNNFEDSYYKIGTRLHYSCNAGYSITEPSFQQCFDSGNWYPKKQPSCNKKTADDDRCPPLHSNDIHINLIRGSLYINNGANIGTEIEVHCLRRYFDFSDLCVKHRLICVSPGIWKGSMPNCESINYCTSPPEIAHSIIINYELDKKPADVQFYGQNVTELESNNMMYNLNSVEWSEKNFRFRIHPIGTKLVYQCVPGYTLRGSSIFQCTANGCWYPHVFPDCVPITSLIEYENNPSLLDQFETNRVEFSLWRTVAPLSFCVVCFLFILCGVSLYRTLKSSFTEMYGLRGSASATVPLNHVSVLETTHPTAPAPLTPNPDRLALLVNAETGQSGLPTYEEAVRDRNASLGVGSMLCRPYRPYGPAITTTSTNRRSRGQSVDFNRQTCPSYAQAMSMRAASFNGSGIDSMGSTDTMTASEVSTNITLDTVSSNTFSSGSHVASCRAISGSLASFDNSSIVNTEGFPVLEESEHEVPLASMSNGNQSEQTPADGESLKNHQTSSDII